jgi:mannose-6-phosphate isomerase-like protein (cupin superfamily)
MATRRVVTVVDEEGRSRFLSDGPAPPVPNAFFEELWAIEAGDDFGHSPVAGDETLEGGAGALRWRVVTIPTDEDYRRMLASVPEDQRDLVDPEGWHTTKTVDLVFVLEGDVALRLDEREVLLHPGDVVVQQGTKHAWYCRSEGPVRLLALMRTFPNASA